MAQEVNESPDQQQLKEDLKGEILQLHPKVNCNSGQHFFKRTSGSEIQCIRCPVGYPVSALTEVKDGHVYIDGQLVI